MSHKKEDFEEKIREFKFMGNNLIPITSENRKKICAAIEDFMHEHPDQTPSDNLVDLRVMLNDLTPDEVLVMLNALKKYREKTK